MACEMENDSVEEMDIEVLSSMWPEDINEAGKQFNIERPGADQDMLEEVTIIEEKTIVDFKRLSELSNYSEKGLSQLAHLVKNWEYKQANADRLLKEKLDNLSKQRQEVKLKQLDIFEEYCFEEKSYSGDKRPISILDAIYDILPDVPRRRNNMVVQNKGLKIEAEYDTVIYWKQRAMHLQKLLKASNQREQNAPVVMGHQDKELRYRFIYNHFLSLHEDAGKTDVEIFTSAGVKESQGFKREVLERGVPAKREITFETELFGSKTFLIYVEPVFSNAGDTIGVNYMRMDVTDQETMRAKQMLATMSHEIKSPLSGGDLVLQLINDILDLSKVESGVMKLEAAKFRPREVVKYVLQTAATSLQKILTLEGHVADDVPAEVIGDVLRIRQILTNLISNAIKFTHKGKVGIKLYVVPAPSSGMEEGSNQKITADRETRGRSLQNHTLDDEPKTPVRNGALIDGGEENHLQPDETIVWICCNVYDTGIGIPENALPTLFKKYMQVGADMAWKYGGTGLGLAICKQLVELMGGHLSVSSREHHGSTFTFILPYKVSPAADNSDDPDELSDMVDHDAPDDANDDDTSFGFFQFQPRTLGSLFTSSGPGKAKKLSNNIAFNASYKLNGLLEDSYSFPSSNIATKKVTSLEDACSVDGANTSLEYESSMRDNLDSAKKIAVGKIPKSMFKPKILLVEDNKINVMVTQSMMKQLGHTIDVVNNGVEAICAVQSYTYDLVLMMTANALAESADECFANV
ncbi:unnamed protein product [Camellia sinensis]